MGVIGDHRTKALSDDDDDHHPPKGKEEAHDEEDVLPSVFEVKMRNYVPRGDCGGGASSMKTTILPNAKAPQKSIFIANSSTTTLLEKGGVKVGKDDDDSRVVNDVNDFDDDEEKEGGEAKKRRNWDLKRDVARRMEKLDRETKRAVAELARDEEEHGREQQQQQQREY